MGTGILEAAAKSGTSSATSYLLIIVVFGVLVLFMFRSSRRRQQNAQNTQRQVMNGARIRTVHGIFGKVVDSDDQHVMVEVSPGVNIKMVRQAVGAVLPDDTPDGVLHTMPETDEAEPEDAGSEPEGDDESARPDQRSDLSR